MKHKLIVTLEYEEEWDETDPYNQDYSGYGFDDWRNVDHDNVDHPLERLEDCGWIIKRKQVKHV